MVELYYWNFVTGEKRYVDNDGFTFSVPDYSKPGVREAVEKDVDDIVDNSIDRRY